jgi:glycosyltransferase involved in cell wall biosynthesis/tetratricopeptide (TPR) repeat protein
MSKISPLWPQFSRRLRDGSALRLWIAEAHWRAGRVAAAETAYRKVLASRPKSVKALAGLGRLLLRERRYSEAAVVWRRATGLSPEAPGPAFRLARALHRAGDVEAAIEQYFRVIDLDHDHAAAFAAIEQLCLALPAVRRRPDAVAEETKAIVRQLLPRRSHSLQARQCAEAVATRIAATASTLAPEPARAHFELALELAPDLPAALRGAAGCLERLGLFVEATELWGRFGDAYPAAVEPRLQMDRLSALLDRGLVRPRRLALSPAPTANVESEMADALLRQAHSAFGDGRFEQAEALLQRVLVQDDRQPDALMLLSRLHLRRRRWSRASAALTRLAATHPTEAGQIAASAISGGRDDGRARLLLAEIHLASGDAQAASGVLAYLAAATDVPTGVVLEAARLARRVGANEEARALYERAMAVDSAEDLSIEVARFRSTVRMDDDALDHWRSLLGRPRVAVEAVNHITRIQLGRSRFAEVIAFVQAEAASLLDGVDARPGHEVNGLMLIVGRYAHSAEQIRDFRALAWLLDRLDATSPQMPVTALLRARVHDRMGMKAAAEHELSRAAAGSAISPDVEIGVSAERCAHAVRYGCYGEALPYYLAVRDEVSKPTSPYHSALRTLSAVNARNGLVADSLYPECLLQEIFAAVAGNPIGYDPEPRRVLMVSGSLGQGGGEKQTVTVARSLVERGASSQLFLAVRWTDRRPSDDFFVPVVNSIDLDWRVYGTDWLTVTDISRALPEVAGRSELSEAVELLPHNYREELIRVSRCILDLRPQTVHIWQDMPVVAVACLLCGVPQFFIHRGSLSPDYWQFNDYQWHTHFRPMQFIYGRLANTPGFFFVNNAEVSCGTDANWLGVSRDDRFRVVYNAVQFESLGENSGPNLQLRAGNGIPADAPVVGGSFRLTAVKRPLLWMQVAQLVIAAIPEVHFVIIGGGEMTEEITDYAIQHGFGERLHLPGRVADVGAWYRVMDVKLLTSEREGIPNAIIEAQHFGVPVVATDVGGIGEALDPGKTGYVIRDASPENFAERVISILSDPDWRERARVLAPEFVHHRFSLDRVLSRLQDYYGWNAPAETIPAVDADRVAVAEI